MLKRTKTVRKIAREIADAADGAFDSYRDGSVVEEPQVTDRILGAIRERIRNRRFGWRDMEGAYTENRPRCRGRREAPRR